MSIECVWRVRGMGNVLCCPLQLELQRHAMTARGAEGIFAPPNMHHHRHTHTPNPHTHHHHHTLHSIDEKAWEGVGWGGLAPSPPQTPPSPPLASSLEIISSPSKPPHAALPLSTSTQHRQAGRQ